MFKIKSLILAVAAVSLSFHSLAQKVVYKVNTSTNRITSLSIDGDMNFTEWLVKTDNTQYKWIDSQFEWGNVAYLDGSVVNGLSVKINRKMEGDDLVETYILQNTSRHTIDLSQVQIYTPWNDNYPDSEICLRERCHAHIWPGDRAAYTYAIHMDGKGPHLAMMLEEGSIVNYTINQRGMDKGGSNTRGIIGLIPEKFILQPNRFYIIKWRIFTHQGEEDFFRKMVEKGGVQVKADRYVASLGDTINIDIITKAQTVTQRYAVQQTGEQRVPISYGKGKPTHIEVLGLLEIDRLLDARANFIFEHQQVKDESSLVYGAYLPYDNKNNCMIQNWQNSRQRSDLNEGRERVGMGIFMAQYAKYVDLHPDITQINRRYLGVSLQLYSNFVHKLQDENYKTWGNVKHNDKHRLYNYPWVAQFYTAMFELTHKKQFLVDAYRTQKAQYENGGYSFYAIGVPVRKLLTLMRENRMNAEADTLLGDFTKVADYYVNAGLHFPKFEVNYEQSIVAPCIEFLCEMYLETKKEVYLESIKRMMPALEAFNGHQPSYHLNEIAIRHWDGYWFGQPQIWGDTFPHYWTCITAQAFALYAQITSDDSYRQRAKAILLANLSHFNTQGHGSASYHYPGYVDAQPTRCSNHCSNDQDWALVYLMQLRGIIE